MTADPKIVITSNVIARFKGLQDGVSGCLFGHIQDDALVVLGFGAITPQQLRNAKEQNSLRFVPAEIQVCGAFTIKADHEEALTCLEKISKEIKCVNSPILLSNVKGEIECQILINKAFKTLSYDTMSRSQLASNFVYIRTKAAFTVTCEKSQQDIENYFDDIRNKVLSENIAFHFSSKPVFLSGKTNSKILGGITADHRVKDLVGPQQDRGSKDYDVVPNQVHLKLTKDFDQENVHNTIPHVRQIRRLKDPFQSAKIQVHIDVMTLAHRNGKVGILFEVLRNSFLHEMNKVEDNLLDQLAAGNGQTLTSPEIFHFLPSQSDFFISSVYTKNNPDKDLRKQREELHQSFGFPLDQPLFRRSQAYTFPSAGSNSGPLTNPHEGLNSGVKGGQVSLVKGQYNYHHYMQDRFDDNGWGCAYRSLQTIVSWFRLQGYTEKLVPTHKQIQECLVKIGDKPSSFVGSRQWIGSTEVSFVLESLLGVNCRILTASTGEEVGCLGSELHYHFQTHGTPIMIGGGVLAHTIIGVDYNRSTGEIKFLILDPHYTGSEDLGVITSKGWVGWKGVKFWTKNAFYNMCLPLRPVGDI